jgi:hypothetical protein
MSSSIFSKSWARHECNSGIRAPVSPVGHPSSKVGDMQQREAITNSSERQTEVPAVPQGHQFLAHPTARPLICVVTASSAPATDKMARPWLSY